MSQNDEFVVVGDRTYRRFLPRPEPVLDGTVRCIFCGQIDDPGVHEAARCPLSSQAEPADVG